MLKLSPSTFEEHLRKAEIKIMRAISPYARIALSIATEERKTESIMKPKLGKSAQD